MTSGAPLAVGVDLGTTYTCAAVAGGDGAARVVQLSGTSQTIPSVVSMTDDGPIAGEAAERRLMSHPANTAREFKRRLGDATPIVLGTEAHPAEVLSGHLLREVLERVERSEGAAPSVVGLAHPASWGPFRLDLLRDAARHAGIDDVVLVPEPVAAAVANRDRVEPGSLVAVYDLGGGTFDAAVVRIGSTDDPHGAEVVGTPEGVERLGGIDFDQAVMAHVDSVVDGQVFGLDRSDPDARGALMRLRSECQAAKEHLSQDSDVDIPVSLPGLQTSVRMTRAEFEAAVRPRLADSLAVFDRVAASAGSGWDDIAAVLLVGGSSNIPVVGQIVGEHTGRPVVTATNPHLAIAAGTASVAARAISPTPEPAPVAAEPAPASTPTPAPSGGTSNRVPLIVGVVAVVALVIGAFVILGGGDDDPVANDATPGVDADTGDADEGDASPPDDAGDDDPATDPAPDTSDSAPVDDEAAATTDAVDGSVGSAALALDVEPCVDVGDQTAAVLATDAGAVIVEPTGARFVAGLGPDDCSIDPNSGTELTTEATGVLTGGSSFGALFSISADGGGVVGSTDTGSSRPCELIVGSTAMTDGGVVFPIGADGSVARIRTTGGNCNEQPNQRLAGVTATAVGVASGDRLAIGGIIDGVPAVRIFTDGETAVELTSVEFGADVAGVDAIVRCGDDWCVFDLANATVHLVDADADPIGSAPLDGDLSDVVAIRSATPSSAGPALLTVESADGSVRVVTVTS